MLNWFKSSLSNRGMTVRIRHSVSTRYTCESGVPQGAVLSPLLFMIYTIELPQILKSSAYVKLQLYADDVKIYGVYDNKTRVEVRSSLQISIERMHLWASNSGIPLNAEKCTVMHFGDEDLPTYVVSGRALICCRSTKDLGVIFDTDLNFSSHIDDIVRKANSTLFCMLRNIKCSDKEILLRLYKSYVLPRLEYCSPVWSPHLKKDILKIEKVQHVFTRLLWYRISHPLGRTDIPCYIDRLKTFGMKTLEERRIISDLTFCFRILRRQSKLSASKYWVSMSTSIRNGSFNLHYRKIGKKKHSLLFNSLFNRCVRWMQLLPPHILEADNSSSFRRRLEKLDLAQLLGNR